MHLAKSNLAGKKRNVLLLYCYAATLDDLIDQMEEGQPRWEDHEIDTLRPHVERAIRDYAIFPRVAELPSAEGRYTRCCWRFQTQDVAANGRKSKGTGARQSCGRTGETSRPDHPQCRNRRGSPPVGARRTFMAVNPPGRTQRCSRGHGRALLDVGREYTSKLQGMSQRIQLQELGEVRTQLSQFLIQVKEAIEQIVKRAERLMEFTPPVRRRYG